jgi:hypothetical protein
MKSTQAKKVTEERLDKILLSIMTQDEEVTTKSAQCDEHSLTMNTSNSSISGDVYQGQAQKQIVQHLDRNSSFHSNMSIKNLTDEHIRTSNTFREEACSEGIQFPDSIIRNKSLLDDDSDDEEFENKEKKQSISETGSNIQNIFRRIPSGDGPSNHHEYKQPDLRTISTVDLSNKAASGRSNNKSVSTNRGYGEIKQSNTWDGFARQGSRMKTLFEDALSEVKASFSLQSDSAMSQQLLLQHSSQENEILLDHMERARSRRRLNTDGDYAARIAFQKTSEALNLERVR